MVSGASGLSIGQTGDPVDGQADNTPGCPKGVRERMLFRKSNESNLGWGIGKNMIHEEEKVLDVFVLFCKNIGEINVAGDVEDINEGRMDRFADGIFTHLEMTKTFGGEVVGPLNAHRVIIADRDGTISEFIKKVEILKHMGDMLKGFDTLINRSNFGFSRASGGVRLALGLPMEGTIQPDQETSNRLRFEWF